MRRIKGILPFCLLLTLIVEAGRHMQHSRVVVGQTETFGNAPRLGCGEFLMQIEILESAGGAVIGGRGVFTPFLNDQPLRRLTFTLGREFNRDSQALSPRCGGRDTTLYQGCVLRGTNTGWFNLNAPRSAGWHQFLIDRAGSGAGGRVDFYVDGTLAGTITGASASPVESIFLGSLDRGQQGSPVAG